MLNILTFHAIAWSLCRIFLSHLGIFITFRKKTMALSMIKPFQNLCIYDTENFPNQILGCNFISLKTGAT